MIRLHGHVVMWKLRRLWLVVGLQQWRRRRLWLVVGLRQWRRHVLIVVLCYFVCYWLVIHWLLLCMRDQRLLQWRFRRLERRRRHSNWR